MSHRCLASLLCLALLGSCVSPERHRELEGANRALQQQLADLKRYQDELQSKNSALEANVKRFDGLVKDAEWIREQKEKLAELQKLFGDGVTPSDSGVPGVSVVRTSEGIAFQVQGEVLFSSGSAEITRSGQETLQQLLPILTRENKRLRIDGHTDTDPIQRSQWKSNLHLSVGRAIAVTEFLIANGFPQDRIAVAGFGQHAPAIVGDTPDVKKQNRRVELLLVNETSTPKR